VGAGQISKRLGTRVIDGFPHLAQPAVSGSAKPIVGKVVLLLAVMYCTLEYDLTLLTKATLICIQAVIVSFAKCSEHSYTSERHKLGLRL
jgi:hypothetical protein